MRLSQLASAFAVVARWAGCNDICPDMRSAEVFWQDVVDRQVSGMPPAVLAGVIIPAKYFPAGQLDFQAGAMDHLIQTDD